LIGAPGHWPGAFSILKEQAMAKMTMRERMTAVINGTPQDQVPFVQYSGIENNDDVFALVGRGNIGLLPWLGATIFHTPNCHRESEECEFDGHPAWRTRLHTPEGVLEEIDMTCVCGMHKGEHRIKEPADYKKLLAYFRDLTCTPNTEGWRQGNAALGEDGIIHTSVSRTPFQQLWVEWVDPVDLACHMMDEPELMAEVFGEMHDAFDREMRAAAQLCVECDEVLYINTPDNVTAPMIGTTYFEEHCVGAYRRAQAILDNAKGGIKIGAHLDGDLKPLWDLIADSPLRLIDSFSPPPNNDTSVADARRMWPEMALGTCFPSTVHMYDEQAIYNMAIQLCEESERSGKLQIQISEDMPKGAWRKSYPQIVRAVADFGPVG
jgi:hypothetical protein